MAFTVTSPAFADGQPVPTQFTCDGNDAPPTAISYGPPLIRRVVAGGTGPMTDPWQSGAL